MLSPRPGGGGGGSSSGLHRPILSSVVTGTVCRSRAHRDVVRCNLLIMCCLIVPKWLETAAAAALDVEKFHSLCFCHTFLTIFQLSCFSEDKSEE